MTKTTATTKAKSATEDEDCVYDGVASSRDGPAKKKLGRTTVILKGPSPNDEGPWNFNNPPSAASSSGMEMSLDDLAPATAPSLEDVTPQVSTPSKMPPPRARPDPTHREGDLFDFSSSGDLRRSDSLGGMSVVSEMSASSASTCASRSTATSGKKTKKASKLSKYYPSPLTAADLEYDELVAEKIYLLSSLPSRIESVRVTWGLIVAGKNVLIPELQRVILHYFFHLIWRDMDRFNPITAALEHLSTVGYFLPNRRLMSENLAKFLALTEPKSSKLRGIRHLCQRQHEYFKYSVRNAVMYLGLHGRDCVTAWVDKRLFEVLRKACINWTPTNTFTVQQLAANAARIISGDFSGDLDEPQTAVECILLALRIGRIDDDFWKVTSANLEAQLITLLIDNLKKVGDNDWNLLQFRQGNGLQGFQVLHISILH